MAKKAAGTAIIRGVSLSGITTKRKRAQDAKVEVWLKLSIEGLKPDDDTLAALHAMEDEPVNVTFASQQTKLEGV